VSVLAGAPAAFIAVLARIVADAARIGDVPTVLSRAHLPNENDDGVWRL
jgi:hypothetical protein